MCDVEGKRVTPRLLKDGKACQGYMAITDGIGIGYRDTDGIDKGYPAREPDAITNGVAYGDRIDLTNEII